MCCLFTVLLFFGPRLGILVWYIMTPIYVNSAFDQFIWGFLGWLFLPWTTLMYVIVSPGGVAGLDWLWVGLMLAADIASYAGGYGRKQIPGYEGY